MTTEAKKPLTNKPQEWTIKGQPYEEITVELGPEIDVFVEVRVIERSAYDKAIEALRKLPCNTYIELGVRCRRNQPSACERCKTLKELGEVVDET